MVKQLTLASYTSLSSSPPIGKVSATVYLMSLSTTLIPSPTIAHERRSIGWVAIVEGHQTSLEQKHIKIYI